jgi:hypothetical protein
MRSQRAAIVEDEARIGPFLEARKVWRQQPKPSEYIPDTKDVHEIHRVAKVLDDPSEGLKTQRSHRATDNAFYSEDRGGVTQYATARFPPGFGVSNSSYHKRLGLRSSIL